MLFFPSFPLIEFTFGLWSKKQEDLRNERDPEFAPPSAYFMGQKRTHDFRSQNWNKPGTSYEKTETLRRNLPSPSTEPFSSSSQSNQFPPTQEHDSELQNQQPAYQTLDDMLSYYKQVT